MAASAAMIGNQSCLYDEKREDPQVHSYHDKFGRPLDINRVETAQTEDSVIRQQDAELYRDGKVVLIPAPSPDPRDPLRLPVWRKVLAIGFLSLFGAMAAAAELILGAMLPVFVLQYAGIDPKFLKVFTKIKLKLPNGSDPLGFLQLLPNAPPIWQVYLLASVPILVMGLANFFLVPMAIAVGRRPVILISGLLAMAGCVWAGKSHSLGEHIAARAIQAIGAGTVESLIPFIIQDFVFVHQRNTAISTVFALQGLIIVGLGLGTTYIIIYLSWRWLYFITAIIGSFFLVMVFLFLPETRWERSPSEMAGIPVAYTESLTPSEAESSHTDSSPENTLKRQNTAQRAWKGFLATTNFVETNEEDDEFVGRWAPPLIRKRRGQLTDVPPSNPNLPDRTWKYDLALFHGEFRWDQGRNAFLDTLRTFFYPHILFVTMLNSAMISAAFAAGYTVAPVLITEPYAWPFLHLGFVLFPMLIASIFVYIVTGPGGDYIANLSAKRRGKRAPEDQILNLILPTVAAIVGTILFGMAGNDTNKYPWPVFLTGLGLMFFGFLSTNTVGAVYVLESYPQLAGPALVNIASFRCIVAFALSFKISDWVIDLGYLESFGIYTALIGFCSLFLPVIYIKGEDWRKRWPAEWAMTRR